MFKSFYVLRRNRVEHRGPADAFSPFFAASHRTVPGWRCKMFEALEHQGLKAEYSRMSSVKLDSLKLSNLILNG